MQATDPKITAELHVSVAAVKMRIPALVHAFGLDDFFPRRSGAGPWRWRSRRVSSATGISNQQQARAGASLV